MLGERRLRLRERHAGLEHRGEVAHVVLEDPVQPAGLERLLVARGRSTAWCRRRPAGSGARARLQQRRRLLDGRRPQNRSASPAASSGCCRYGPGHLAAQPRRRHQLARVRQPGGVERAAQALERVQVGLGEHLRHVLLLVDADAVLAGDRAAGVQAGVDDQARQLLGLLGLALDARRRNRPAGAGCRRRRGRRWRRSCRTRSPSSSMRSSTSGSLVRGITPSWTK